MGLRRTTAAVAMAGWVAAACGGGTSGADERTDGTVTIAPSITTTTTTTPAPTLTLAPHDVDDWVPVFEIPERDLTISSRGFQPRARIGYDVGAERPYGQRLIEVQQYDIGGATGTTVTRELRGTVGERPNGLLVEFDVPAGEPPAALSILDDNRAALLGIDGDIGSGALAQSEAAIGALIPLPREPIGIGARWFTHRDLFNASSVPGTFEVLAIEGDLLTIRVFGSLRDQSTERGRNFTVEVELSGELVIDLATAQVDGSLVAFGTATAPDGESTSPFAHTLTFERLAS